jgi:hypothetical protein
VPRHPQRPYGLLETCSQWFLFYVSFYQHNFPLSQLTLSELAMNALKDDSPDASPPSNMFKSLIFQACFVAIIAISVFGLKGEQTRRELDVQKQQARYEGEPRGC